MAAWSEEFGMMTATIKLVIILEVNQIHQNLVARVAHKTSRVPDFPWYLISHDPALNYPSTLLTLLLGEREWGIGVSFAPVS